MNEVPAAPYRLSLVGASWYEPLDASVRAHHKAIDASKSQSNVQVQVRGMWLQMRPRSTNFLFSASAEACLRLRYRQACSTCSKCSACPWREPEALRNGWVQCSCQPGDAGLLGRKACLWSVPHAKMGTRAVLQVFERYQKERVAFVSAVAEMSKSPQVEFSMPMPLVLQNACGYILNLVVLYRMSRLFSRPAQCRCC